jgi:hypothetical protein
MKMHRGVDEAVATEIAAEYLGIGGERGGARWVIDAWEAMEYLRAARAEMPSLPGQPAMSRVIAQSLLDQLIRAAEVFDDKVERKTRGLS